MASAKQEYRDNPKRAIFVTGEINQDMIDRLTPEILRLQVASKEPITVYIDSIGGSPYHGELLVRLLKRRDQDGVPRTIITVVTGLAGSAAADVLAAGDYAIAYEHAVVHFHGTRMNRRDGITQESALSIAEDLQKTNEGYALDLAERSLGRFMFVYMQISSHFPNVKEKEPGLTDIECLARCLLSRLGSGSAELLRRAVEKHKQTHELLQHYRAKLRERQEEFSRPAIKDAFLLHCLIEWELSKNVKAEWSFRTEGLDAIRDDFVLLVDYEDGRHMALLEQLSRMWGVFTFDGPLMLEYSRMPAEEKEAYLEDQKKSRFREAWHFLVSICRGLQQGENRLSAEEAYWLGLVNEVSGSSLVSIRDVIEKQHRASTATVPAKRRTPSKKTSNNRLKALDPARE